MPIKINLKRSDKYVVLSNLNIYYTWKNIENSYGSNKIKISAPKLNEKFELPDGSYSVSDIPDYFEYIIKKMIYVSKIKTRYYLKILMHEPMKLLGSNKIKTNKDKMMKMCLI